MAALVCEICGGKLMGKPGGIFECDSCGMEYSTEWAKAKIQEIKGTVKVEGTVEVQGTVKVEGPVKVEGGVNIESLLKRGKMALEDKNWEDAKRFFDDALSLNAECVEAYVGLACANYKASDIDELLCRHQTEDWMKELESDANFQKALRFEDSQATDSLRKRVDEIARNDLDMKSKASKDLADVRKRNAPAQGLIVLGDGNTFGLRADGTVLATGNNDRGRFNVSMLSNSFKPETSH